MSKSLALLAFEALYTRLVPGKSITLHEFNTYTETSDNSYPSKAPLFITWNKNGHLRGCIGTFASSPTEKGVSRYALVSAMEDPRFPPITQAELPQLTVDVTLLDNFVPIQNPQDWLVGKNGLKVQFQRNGRFYLGTFLPSVAEEQEWDVVDTLWNLLRKADYLGISRSSTVAFYEQGIDEGWLELERYDGLKSGLDYKEFWKVHSDLAKS